MLISTERTRTARAPKLARTRPEHTPRGRSLVVLALALLILVAVIVVAQSQSSGAALFTAVLVNAAAAPLAHARRLGRA